MARRSRSEPRYLPGVGERERSRRAFSTVILRPSISALFKFVTHAVACSEVSRLRNPKPLDSLVRGSVTSLTFTTFPYFENFLSNSLSLVLGCNPEIYKVVPTIEDSSFLGLLGGDLLPRLGETPRLGDLEPLGDLSTGDLDPLLPRGGGGGGEWVYCVGLGERDLDRSAIAGDCV